MHGCTSRPFLLPALVGALLLGACARSEPVPAEAEDIEAAVNDAHAKAAKADGNSGGNGS